MDEEKQFIRRSHILLGFFALCLLLFGGILYDAQVVNAAEYLARSTTQVTTTEKVEASRGILTDRNGKVLVSNRQTYTITFDPDLVPEVVYEDDDVLVVNKPSGLLSEAKGEYCPERTLADYGLVCHRLDRIRQA